MSSFRADMKREVAEALAKKAPAQVLNEPAHDKYAWLFGYLQGAVESISAKYDRELARLTKCIAAYDKVVNEDLTGEERVKFSRASIERHLEYDRMKSELLKSLERIEELEEQVDQLEERNRCLDGDLEGSIGQLETAAKLAAEAERVLPWIDDENQSGAEDMKRRLQHAITAFNG